MRVDGDEVMEEHSMLAVTKDTFTSLRTDHKMTKLKNIITVCDKPS